jgi:DNA topoisomerase-1
MLAARALREMGPPANEREAKRNVNAALDQVAARLRNTRAVCRKYYVHPSIIENYHKKIVVPAPAPLSDDRRARPSASLRHDELGVLQFLQQEVAASDSRL